MTVLCITPNTNVERIWDVPGLRLGVPVRARTVFDLPSGKGNNVARGIRIIGGEAICCGFLGGCNGQAIASGMEALGIPARWTWIEGNSRVTMILVDSTQPELDSTSVREPGPTVTREDWARLQEDGRQAAMGAAAACLSGSVPPGTPLEEVTRLVALLVASGTPVWVDCEKAVLRAAIAGRPAGVKINAEEAGELVGREIRSIGDAAEAASDMLEWGVESAIVTLGAEGAVLVSEGLRLHGSTHGVRAVSTVGSGDAFFSGWLNGLVRGLDAREAMRHGLAAGAANALSVGACKFEREEFLTCLAATSVVDLPPVRT